LQNEIRARRDLPSAVADPATAEVRGASQRPPKVTVALAALLAAVLDLTFAFVFYGFQGATPERILRTIAAGVLGHAAATGGSWVLVLGAALHFLIAGCAAFIYYVASRRWPRLAPHWTLSGAGFGIAMYVAMHFIVIPLSRLPFRLQSLHNVVGELFSHIFLFGMVIAYGVARAARTQRG
jgi:hypothetical protein